MQVVRKQRFQETMDTLERERLLGRHRPAPCIKSWSLESHLCAACKLVSTLIPLRSSDKPM